jgi:hypothetical protein
MRYKLIALAIVAAAIGIVAATVAAGSHSNAKRQAQTASKVMRVVPRRAAAHVQVFKPPTVRAHRPAVQVRAELPATGFDLSAVAALALAAVAAGLLLRLLAALAA